MENLEGITKRRIKLTKKFERKEKLDKKAEKLIAFGGLIGAGLGLGACVLGTYYGCHMIHNQDVQTSLGWTYVTTLIFGGISTASGGCIGWGLCKGTYEIYKKIIK